MNSVNLLAVILYFLSNSWPSSTLEVPEAAQIAIDYYNDTINMAERVVMVERFYELERELGVFLPARLQIYPKLFIQISEDIDKLEFEAKHKHRGNEKILRTINNIEEELSHNYGPRDRNFRIRKDDPLIENLRAVERMKTHWTALMQEFTAYITVQQHFPSAFRVLGAFGIDLSPDSNSDIVIILDKEKAEEMFSTYGKRPDFNPDVTFADIYERVLKASERVPRQTSSEILVLHRVLNGEDIDSGSRAMLRGFVPELNKNAVEIAARMKALEETIKAIEDESQQHTQYIMDKREDFLYTLLELRKQFEFEPEVPEGKEEL